MEEHEKKDYEKKLKEQKCHMSKATKKRSVCVRQLLKTPRKVSPETDAPTAAQMLSNKSGTAT